MKYLKLSGLIILSVISITFLTSVYNEIKVFGLITTTPEGEPVGVLNGHYPTWFHLCIGFSIGALIATGVFIWKNFVKSSKQ